MNHKLHREVVRQEYGLKTGPSTRKCPVCSPGAIIYIKVKVKPEGV